MLMGSKSVYGQCGQLLSQQVGAAVKPHGAGVCVRGSEGADRRQQVGKNKVQSLTVRM